MYQLILIIHVIAAISIIALVLVQQGKGATTGAAFGSGASQTVFGSKGSGSFLLKVTIGFVVIFFSTSVGLNYLMGHLVKAAQEVRLPVSSDRSAGVVPPVSPSNIPFSTSTEPLQQPVTKSSK